MAAIRQLLILGIILFAFSHIYGQIITLDARKKGDQEFDSFSFSSAIQYYQQALKSNPDDYDLNVRIATCYRKLNQFSEAERYYGNALEIAEEPDTGLMIDYAEILVTNTKYSEAIEWYEKVLPHDDPSIQKSINRKVEALKEGRFLQPDNLVIDVIKVPFNSDGSDFSPVYYKTGLVFTSSRDPKDWIARDSNWDGNPYLNLYLAEWKGGSFEIQPLPGFNSKYHIGSGAFFNQYQNFVFTRNASSDDLVGRSDQGVSNLQLYFAQTSSRNVSITPFEFNNPNYSLSHPAITENGEFLVFTSDMPGGLGGFDLYISQRIDGIWHDPENIGGEINTPFDESFPVFISDEEFIFSSNGHPGMGGLDLYYVTMQNGSITNSVIHLGSTLNSSKDDFGLISKDGLKTGFFSSNRGNGKVDDIYMFHSINSIVNEK